MPFILPFLPAIIGAGGAIGSSLINRSGRNNNNQVLLPPGLDSNALISALGDQRGLANFLTGEGKRTLTEGRDVLGQPLSFLQSLLGGDRTQMMETLAPEIASINAQFRAPAREAAITGRGSSLSPDIEASRQSAISNQFFQVRPKAADKLTQIAQGLMNLGVQELGFGGNIFGDITGSINSYNQTIRGLQAQTANQQSSGWGSLGASLGPLLTQILAPSGGGGGTNPSPPPIDFGNIGTPPEPTWGEIDASRGLTPAVVNSLTMSGYQEPEINASWLNDILDLSGMEPIGAPWTGEDTRSGTPRRPWWQ